MQRGPAAPAAVHLQASQVIHAAVAAGCSSVQNRKERTKNLHLYELHQMMDGISCNLIKKVSHKLFHTQISMSTLRTVCKAKTNNSYKVRTRKN